MGHRLIAVPRDSTLTWGGTSNIDNDARKLSGSVGATQ